MENFFLYTSFIIVVIAYGTYVISIVNSQVRPHRITRFVSAVGITITTLALFSQNNTNAIFLSVALALGCWIIFFLSIYHGLGGRSLIDLVCLFVALSGIALWYTTKNPAIALYCSIGTDVIGSIPAVIKTFKFPKTENVIFYLLLCVASVVNIVAIIFQKTNSGYLLPLYEAFYCLIFITIIFSKKEQGKQASRVVNSWAQKQMRVFSHRTR